jgi:hypothetical protein
MARKPTSAIVWPSLSLEGNLIAPAMLARITDPDTAVTEAASYGLRKGLTLREEISQAFRVGQAHFDDFAKLAMPTPEATARFVRGLLAEAFGFIDLKTAAVPLAFLAGDGRVPIGVCPPTDALDKRSAFLSLDRPRSAAYAVQDHLNAHDAALWGLATNGHHLRLMRDNASLTRPAHVEADLRQIFTTEDIASFTALWLLIHRSRFGLAGTPATDCALERWRDQGAREGETARNRLAGQVEEALKLLGTGFLDQNPDLRTKVQSGEIPLTDYFNELLRLVYRLIFLMVAEDRDLLHAEATPAAARDLYLKGYSLTALRRAATRRAAWDRHTDRWEGLNVTFRALATGQPRLGLTALGGLFAPTALHLLHSAKLQNRALLHALYRLSWLPDPTGMVPVNWRAMETEELGSVYESLLELQPQLDGTRLIFATDTAEQKGNQRKTTGSYYTPDSLVQALLDTALDPVLDQCEAAADPADALLKLKVIDPACGSGHFLLAAARRIATRLARARHPTHTAADYRHALRDAARACLHGVDRNPMAVELTKVALWIETVDPGKPLGFFDTQIRCGDALLGLFDLKALDQGIPDAAYKPLSGDDKATARHYAAKNRKEKAEAAKIAAGFDLSRQTLLATAFQAMRAMPEDDLAAIDAKSARAAALAADEATARAHRAADLWISAFLAPKVTPAHAQGPDGLPRRGAETIATSGMVWEYLRGVQPYSTLQIDAALTGARAFHWPLEFPDVFQNGGFDVVLGNPPWERIKLQEQEFFAARSPAIATAANKAARDRLIKALAEAPEGTPDRALYDEFQQAKRLAEASSEFMRVAGEDGGRFPLTGRGDVNTYALFAELFSRLTGPKGRSGVIVPTGIATDATTAPFFADLVSKRRLAQLVDFENRAGLFPAVDSRMKFCLLTLGRNEGTARFAFFLTDPGQLAEPERNFTLTPGAIARLNPNTRTAPVFRSRKDAELTERIYEAAPVLIEEAKAAVGNPWDMNFHTRIWHMAEDSKWFRTAAQLTAEGFRRNGANWLQSGPLPSSHSETFVPLYEAKLMNIYDHRAASYSRDTGERGYRVLPPTSDEEHADPSFEPEFYYWVPLFEVQARLNKLGWGAQWLLGWRDITSSTNERTLLANVFPLGASADTFLLMLPFAQPRISVVGLIASVSSIAVDYAARQKLGGVHLKLNVIKQLPILPPTFYTPERLAFLTPRVLQLTYTSHALAPFARDLGFDGPPFPWDEPRRAHLRADLDAFYARAYRLTRDDLRYILDPADVMGPDYPSETFRVLKEKELRLYNEYRTRRLVLEAWDRMEADGTFAALDL